MKHPVYIWLSNFLHLFGFLWLVVINAICARTASVMEISTCRRGGAVDSGTMAGVDETENIISLWIQIILGDVEYVGPSFAVKRDGGCGTCSVCLWRFIENHNGFLSIDLILFEFVEFDSMYKYRKYLLPNKITKEIFLVYFISLRREIRMVLWLIGYRDAVLVCLNLMRRVGNQIGWLR